MDWRLLSPFDLSRILLFGSKRVSSEFLTGTFCCKITHASGFYPAWPGQAVSVGGSPNRSGEVKRNQGRITGLNPAGWKSLDGY